MDNFQQHMPGRSLLIIAGYVIAALFIFQAIGLFFASVFYDIPFNEFEAFLSDPAAYPSGRAALLLIQGIYSFGSFILAPLFFFIMHEKRFPGFVIRVDRVALFPVLLTVLIIVSFMFVNAWFIEFNSNAEWPEFLKGMEKWARELEERGEQMTKFLTDFSDPGSLIAGLIVIAVIPGIGEELLFRGIIQNKLKGITGNIHMAIWISALVFSAFHLQFFGFIPRVLLGALFGYIYFWSGSLAMAMIAHFIQNGLTLVMIYLYRTGNTEYNIESTDSVPVYLVLIFTAITVSLLYMFRNYYFKQKNKPA